MKKEPPVTLANCIGHFKTVTHHKYLVWKGCSAAGLYRQGLLHDLSKFSPVEFGVGARYFQGNRSPNNAERECIGYSRSWLHHKGRNYHHFEFWMDYNLHPTGDEQMVIPVRMPGRYVVEMLMDRIAASKVYRGEDYTDADPLKYYLSGKSNLFMHPDTSRLLEKLLRMLAEDGEEKTFAYVRAHLHKGRRPVRGTGNE